MKIPRNHFFGHFWAKNGKNGKKSQRFGQFFSDFDKIGVYLPICFVGTKNSLEYIKICGNEQK